jgi:hypothetical protein
MPKLRPRNNRLAIRRHPESKVTARRKVGYLRRINE